MLGWTKTYSTQLLQRLRSRYMHIKCAALVQPPRRTSDSTASPSFTVPTSAGKLPGCPAPAPPALPGCRLGWDSTTSSEGRSLSPSAGNWRVSYLNCSPKSIRMAAIWQRCLTPCPSACQKQQSPFSSGNPIRFLTGWISASLSWCHVLNASGCLIGFSHRTSGVITSAGQQG